MNKRVGILTGIGVVLAIPAMLGVLHGTRLGEWVVMERGISWAISVLSFPMRVYLIPSVHGQWSPMPFFMLLLISGAVWGLLAGAVSAALRKHRAA